MQQYLDLIKDVLTNGIEKDSRAKVDGKPMGTLAVFGRQLRFDLTKGLPVVTTKKIHLKSVIHELLWMLDGGTNSKDLEEHGVTIWREWAKENGDLGPIYGRQWRAWPAGRPGDTIDQVQQVIDGLRVNPNDRRLVVSAWNTADIGKMALPPCHLMWQVGVLGGRLHLDCRMRSVDVFLGLPFNIASYAILTHLIGHVTGIPVGDLVMSLVDTHIYKNHVAAAKEQLTREPRNLPVLSLRRSVRAIDEFTYDDIMIDGYDPHPAIKADVAV